jgi:uncharacterized membrane protein YdbT with pleckstrin-like domain
MEEEKIICEVTPSQLLNLKPFLICFISLAAIVTAAILAHENLILLLGIIPVAYAFWRWLEIRTMTVKITNQRIIISEGILNKTTHETELYRVRDSLIEEPFFYRLFGCGNISVFSTDEAEATIRMQAYKKPHWIKDQIRNYSEICRQKKRWGNDNVMIHEHSE